jgi:hypothetical protein
MEFSIKWNSISKIVIKIDLWKEKNWRKKKIMWQLMILQKMLLN